MGTVDLAPVAPCRACGVDVLTVHDIDDNPIQLDPAFVYDGSTVGDGWRVQDGRRWVVHIGAVSPDARFVFRSHTVCVPARTPKGHPRMTQPNPFGTAAPPGGDGPPMAELEGKLALIDVTTIERGIVTTAGVADAVKCKLVLLDSGEQFENAALWGTVLTGQFTPGTKYVGRVTKGTGKPGQNPPWLWADGDAADQAKAVAFITWQTQQSVSTQAAPAGAPPAPAATPVDTSAAKAPWQS